MAREMAFMPNCSVDDTRLQTNAAVRKQNVVAQSRNREKDPATWEGMSRGRSV